MTENHLSHDVDGVSAAYVDGDRIVCVCEGACACVCSCKVVITYV